MPAFPDEPPLPWSGAPQPPPAPYEVADVEFTGLCDPRPPGPKKESTPA